MFKSGWISPQVLLVDEPGLVQVFGDLADHQARERLFFVVDREPVLVIAPPTARLQLSVHGPDWL
ncbi:hypothetical protein [Streptomyces sp. NPDC002845]